MLFRECVGRWVRSVRHRYVGQLGYYFHHQIPALQDWLQLGVRFYDPALGCYTQHGSPYVYAGDRPTIDTDTDMQLAGNRGKKAKTKDPAKVVPPKKSLSSRDRERERYRKVWAQCAAELGQCKSKAADVFSTAALGCCACRQRHADFGSPCCY